MSAGGGTRAIVAAFFANLGIAIAKFVGFLITGSASMLAETIHCVADTGNQGLLLLGGKRSREARRRAAPVRLRPRALLLGVRGRPRALQPRRDVRHLRGHPARSSTPTSSSAPSSPSASSASPSCSRATRSTPLEGGAHALRRGQSWSTFIRRAREPELPVVLLEDTGALIGLMFALVARRDRRDHRQPAVGRPRQLVDRPPARVIAVILAVEMKSLLIGESGRPSTTQRSPTPSSTAPTSTSSSTCAPSTSAPRSCSSGPRCSSVPTSTSASWPTRSTRSRCGVRLVVPIARPFYVEPDIFRPPPGDASQIRETH